MFNITLKYVHIFKNKPPASWVMYITRDFLTCYSSSYCSSMIKVNVVCWKKLWLNNLKCRSTSDAFFLLTSSQSFNLTLNSVSDFPMYWIPQILLSISYSILYAYRWVHGKCDFFCHTTLKRLRTFRTCLQHKFPDFEKYLVKNSIFFFLDCLCSFPSTIFLHPGRCWRILYLLIAEIGASWKTSLNSWFIWSIF